MRKVDEKGLGAAVAAYSEAMGQDHIKIGRVLSERRNAALSAAILAYEAAKAPTPEPAGGGVSVEALRGVVSRWESNREYLNVAPDGRARFFEREAAALSAPAPAKAAPESGGPVDLPSDVTQLVIAARAAAYDGPSNWTTGDLDKAVEAFAGRVPWEDEPDDEIAAAPSPGETK